MSAAAELSARPRVSVIIPVRDDTPRLLTCLELLRAQSYPADLLEVVVADNGSSDDVAAAVAAHPGVRVVREETPGSYIARNAAVAASTGEVLAFTDADCRPRRDWVEAGVGALRGDDGPDAVGGAISLVFRNGAAPVSGPELYEALHDFDQRRYIERLGFAATANLFVPRTVFDAVGPFDARLKSGGDLNFGNRLGAAGYRLGFAPGATVDHPSRPTWAELGHKAARVSRGLVDLDASSSPRTALGRAGREVRHAIGVWVRVWRADRPTGIVPKLRYAAAYAYVQVIRAGVRVRALVARQRRGA